MRALRAAVRGCVVGAIALTCAGGAAPADVTVVNHAGVAIVELYVSSAEEDSWGDNRLNQKSLSPGQSFRVAPLRSAGCQVDVRAIYANGTLEDKRGVDACRSRQVSFDAGGAAVPNAAARTVTIVNHAARPITELYVSPAASDDWGEDLLANHPIPTGGAADVTPLAPCLADLRVVFDNRAAEERRAVDLCAHPRLEIKPGWTTLEQLTGRFGSGAPFTYAFMTLRG
jgi:hypothetical protein